MQTQQRILETMSLQEIDQIVENHYLKNKETLFSDKSGALKAERERAWERFRTMGFPHAQMENWRGTDLKPVLEDKIYNFGFESMTHNIDLNEVFRCDVPNFNTFPIALLNGSFIYNQQKIQQLENGVIVGSIAAAAVRFPELFEKYYQKQVTREDGLIALNTAVANDGFFIYVPDQVTVKQPIQIVNIVDCEENLFLNIRNLIVLGKNSHLRLVHCDETKKHAQTFINVVSEIFIDAGATLDHYKLQNKDSKSTLVNSLFVNQEKNSRFNTHAISLNGGIIRNNLHIKLAGEYAETDVSGLYLMDKMQHIDNQLFIEHAAPNCLSNQLFKGILDDQASGVFSGHVLVNRDAQKTNAFQSNKNILLTDKATIDSKPFLEIYADDVKCSHGATVGQLDNEALFYIRSRGISESNAKILLMYAFAAEIVQKIKLPELRLQMDDMVKKRLRGELSYCEQCVLHCSTSEKKQGHC